MKTVDFSGKWIRYVEMAMIIGLAAVPLFATFPYRVNIFISWEGAYRMSRGELPFRDFGTALGGMYWVVPALFMKIFGTGMLSLVKAQVFMNILSGFAFRTILRNLALRGEVVLLSLFVFCISYSFFNFWPWYNHSVIVYQLVAFAFLLNGLMRPVRSLLWFFLAAMFSFFSLMTKQDAGAMGIFICMALLVTEYLYSRAWVPFLLYAITVTGFMFIVVVLFRQHQFLYWFNHGQSPHTARISLTEILGDFFNGSAWIKFYIFLIVTAVFTRYKSLSDLAKDKRTAMLVLLTIIVLGEAAVFQVTSYTPPDNNIFFHSFAFACIFHLIWQTGDTGRIWKLKVSVLALGVLIWWSGSYWKYVERVLARVSSPRHEVQNGTGENVVNRSTYMLNQDTTEIPMSEWKFTSLESFKGIYMPGPTVDGIDRLMQRVKGSGDVSKLKILNMTELTPLAVEIPYEPERGSHYPLWYHLGVSMFNRQAEMFEKRIQEKQYDFIFFENIPNLNNFFPFRVRDSLRIHYRMVDSFPAPRRGDTKGTVEIYQR